ncbi:MAG: hypothetical protein KIS68_13640 [Bauldia sp.]|nr:hypothetical protein [Bauldia sp.]
MRLARLLPALAAALVAVAASAQEPAAPDPARSAVTLFYPRTLVRTEERDLDGTATWRMADLGPVRALEAVLSFPGADGDMIVLIEENPFRDLPDDMLVHAWPQWPATAEGPAAMWAYLVGVEMDGDAQAGLIATARGDWTTGLMAAGAARNHERLRAAGILIVELGLPDGKAFVGLRLGAEQRSLLAELIPADGPAFPLAGPAEPRILSVGAPDGTGGVLWDTPTAEGGGVMVRGRFYLDDRGIRFNLVIAMTPDGLVMTVEGNTRSPGAIVALSVLTPDGEIALPAGSPPAAAGNGSSTLAFGADATAAALEILRGPGTALTLLFADADGAAPPVFAALPQSWNPFAYLAPAP